MGSIDMNSLGDIALGFSASNGTNPSVFPSVFYTARHAGDPPGQMTLGEGSIKTGPARKPAATAGAIIRQSTSIRPTTRLSGTSTSMFPRQAPLDGGYESA